MELVAISSSGDLPELRTSLVAQTVKNLPAMREERAYTFRLLPAFSNLL